MIILFIGGLQHLRAQFAVARHHRLALIQRLRAHFADMINPHIPPGAPPFTGRQRRIIPHRRRCARRLRLAGASRQRRAQLNQPTVDIGIVARRGLVVRLIVQFVVRRVVHLGLHLCLHFDLHFDSHFALHHYHSSIQHNLKHPLSLHIIQSMNRRTLNPSSIARHFLKFMPRESVIDQPALLRVYECDRG